MLGDNRIVHGLWIGDYLSPVEQLTIQSFIDHGHEFWLWAYTTPEGVPAGALIKNASTILPDSAIFRYQYGNEFGHGQGSLAGFSDIFRYKLLFEYGGWWTDMDITCLRPLDFQEPYVFRSHDVLPVVGNLMKCPKGSPLMIDCYAEALREVNAENTDWLKPIRILNAHIARHQLQEFIHQDISNPDRWETVDAYRCFPLRLRRSYYVFHWMNEEWRAKGIEKSQCVRFSLMDRLMARHQINIERRMPLPWHQFIFALLRKTLTPLIPRPLRIFIKKGKLFARKSFFWMTKNVLAYVPSSWKRAGKRWLFRPSE